MARLGEEYDWLVTSLTTHPELVSLNEFYTHLLSFDMGVERHNVGLQFEGASASQE